MLVKELFEQQWVWHEASGRRTSDGPEYPFIYGPSDEVDIVWSISGFKNDMGDGSASIVYECLKWDNATDGCLDRKYCNNQYEVGMWCKDHNIPAPSEKNFKWLNGDRLFMNNLLDKS